MEFESGRSMLSVAELFVILLVTISIRGGAVVHDPFYCYSEDPVRQWTGLGGIHSPYEAIRGQNIDANVSTCNPSKFWMAGRHGARFPMYTELVAMIRDVPTLHNQILTNYDQGRTSLCASDFELFRNWQFDPNMTMDVADMLSASGWNEMEALAKRYQAAFPTILPATYSPNEYFFRHTATERSEFSIRAFADGLFGVNGNEQVQFEDIPEPDVFLRGYNFCPMYLELYADRTERDLFRQGPEYQEMVVQVSAKLGFHNSHVLRNSDVALLVLQCIYEQSLNLHYTYPSPFCAAFSVANAQVIEYSEDIDWYRSLGYGRPEYRRLYENLSCFLLQDMLRFIQSNDVNDDKARILNGHTGLLLLILHFEAFAGDAPLTRHNFAQQTQRVWRSTEILPMSFNLAVVRYDCNDGDNDLLFLFNEKPLQIPGCNSNGVCKQSLILERFNSYINANCMEIYCTNS